MFRHMFVGPPAGMELSALTDMLQNVVFGWTPQETKRVMQGAHLRKRRTSVPAGRWKPAQVARDEETLLPARKEVIMAQDDGAVEEIKKTLARTEPAPEEFDQPTTPKHRRRISLPEDFFATEVGDLWGEAANELQEDVGRAPGTPTRASIQSKKGQSLFKQMFGRGKSASM